MTASKKPNGCFYALLLLCAMLFMNEVTILAQTGLNPVMKISNRGKTETPIKIETLKIDIKVVGQIATTTLDMTFRNNNSRIMDGEFNFPLGEGQTVSRFALDINGNLREGVVVDKETGRKTFEAIARRQVDPGLLEKTAGNNFRARVYPIPALGTRRIVIAFEQELSDKGDFDLFLLPLSIKESVAKFSIHAEVIKNKVKLNKEKNELTNLSFKKWNDSYIANLELENYTPDKQIALSFPHVGDSEKVFTASKNNGSDSAYFYVNIRPENFEKEKVLPSVLTILWDNSSSAKNRNIEKEINILDIYLHKIDNATVYLVPFNIKTEKEETFQIVNGNWENLKNRLKSMDYDGGTSYGTLDFSKLKGTEILMFSDGISNFGNSEPKYSDKPIVVVNSNPIANHSLLTYLAQRSGGVYVNLNKLTAIEGEMLFSKNSYHFISAKVESGNISNVYPSMPCQFDKSFSIAGILKGNEATVVLNFGFGNTVVYSKKVVIKNDQSGDIELLRRFWAEKKIAELSLNQKKNKLEITQTGKDFGIVTENTSLIVLETLSDYLQYKIVPPKEMQAEYFSHIDNSEKLKFEKTQNHIEKVVILSEAQTKWWNTKYPLVPLTKINKNISGDEEDGYVYSWEGADSTSTLLNIVENNVVVEYELSADDSGTEDRAIQPVLDSDEEATESIVDQADIVVSPIKKEVNAPSKGNIQLNAWDPETPYLKVLQYAAIGQEFPTYLKLKNEYGNMPAFYIDASDFFFKLNEKELAKKILSNLAELNLESPQLLRILGKKLLQLDCKEEAVLVFEKVLELKREEPQSYRDLGHAYEVNGNPQQAITTLYEVVKREWDGRFSDIELIVMNEINNIILIHPNLNTSFIDKRLIKNEPVDIRVEVTWDTDNCDMDLWVTDPYGEKCMYSHKNTRLGGKISNDFTGGYGPEEFMLKKAANGEYLVEVNYFGTRSQTILAPVHIHVAFITDYGKVTQKRKEVIVRLENQKEVINIGSFKFGESPQ